MKQGTEEEKDAAAAVRATFTLEVLRPVHSAETRAYGYWVRVVGFRDETFLLTTRQLSSVAAFRQALLEQGRFHFWRGPLHLHLSVRQHKINELYMLRQTKHQGTRIPAAAILLAGWPLLLAAAALTVAAGLHFCCGRREAVQTAGAPAFPSGTHR